MTVSGRFCMDLWSKDSVKIQTKNNCWIQTDLPKPMGDFTFRLQIFKKLKKSWKKKPRKQVLILRKSVSQRHFINFCLLPNKSYQLPKDRPQLETLMNFPVNKITVVLKWNRGIKENLTKPMYLLNYLSLHWFVFEVPNIFIKYFLLYCLGKGLGGF